jgi:hypothetical protein
VSSSGSSALGVPIRLLAPPTSTAPTTVVIGGSSADQVPSPP